LPAKDAGGTLNVLPGEETMMKSLAVLIVVFIAYGCGKAHHENLSDTGETPKDTVQVLTYKQEDPDKAVSVYLTVFGGFANATVTRVANGKTSKETWSVPSDRFKSIWNGLSDINAIASRRLGEKFDPIESTDYHIVMTIPGNIYAIPETETNDTFLAWVHLITTREE
jgi:hypothetical protein